METTEMEWVFYVEHSEPRVKIHKSVFHVSFDFPHWSHKERVVIRGALCVKYLTPGGETKHLTQDAAERATADSSGKLHFAYTGTRWQESCCLEASSSTVAQDGAWDS